MREELFGPILTVYVYDPEKVDETLDILDKQGFVAEIAVSEHFFFEDVVLINGYL